MQAYIYSIYIIRGGKREHIILPANGLVGVRCVHRLPLVRMQEDVYM